MNENPLRSAQVPSASGFVATALHHPQRDVPGETGSFEIWGGVRGNDLDAHTGDVMASLYCRAVAGERGGDIYCAYSDATITRVVVADVVGHGEEASEVSEWLYEQLRLLIDSLEVDELLGHLNNLAEARGLEALTTAVAVAVDLSESRLLFSDAGHPPVLLHRRQLEQWEALRVSSGPHGANLPLGILPDTVYHLGSARLDPGDRLFLYTDGLLDAPDHSGEPFGWRRLSRVLHDSAHQRLSEVKRSVLAAIRRHTGGELEHDDTTLATIELVAGAASASVSTRRPALASV